LSSPLLFDNLITANSGLAKTPKLGGFIKGVLASPTRNR
jgi:hypothetical protein